LAFNSILFERAGGSAAAENASPPDFFRDLNLDRIFEGVTKGREEYGLMPYFYSPLRGSEEIIYRQEVFRELEENGALAPVLSFAEKMRRIREQSARVEKLYYKHQKEICFLETVESYCGAVAGLHRDLSLIRLKSRGFLSFFDYLEGYVGSERFRDLLEETERVKKALASVKYCVLINGSAVTVRRLGSEPDYRQEIEAAFGKFRHGAAKDYGVSFLETAEMNHVEARILDFVAELYPDVFSSLGEYCVRNLGYQDETIRVFDREIEFYAAYLEYIGALKAAGLKFCYPEISERDKEIFDEEGFDLALAQKLLSEKSAVVVNDFFLKGEERVFVVSGPNQGGKTTFARTFGQLHYLACLGCPVPGGRARLFLFDRLFTHFEREERMDTLRGKLQDDLLRIRDILAGATPRSIIILNEIFNSTTLQDTIFLSKKIMSRVAELDLLCVWVTFVDELASFSGKTVSVLSTVAPDNPSERTFKIVRKPPDGLAYALSVAERHGVTYDRLKGRLKQ